MRQVSPHYTFPSLVDKTLFMYLLEPTQFNMGNMTMYNLCSASPISSLNNFNKLETLAKSRISYKQNKFTIRICNNINTSSNVMVISLSGRWNMFISRCHFSIKVESNTLSMTS